MAEGLRAWLATGSDDTAIYSFEFNVPFGASSAIALLLLVALAATFYYWRNLRGLTTPVRSTLVLFRVLAISLVLFLFLDPCIVKQHIRPGDQHVAILFDDSRSMEILTDSGRSRGEELRAAYEANGEQFEKSLRRRFQVSLYRFGEYTERVRGIEDLDFDQRESNITGAIQDVLRDLQGSDVAGIVLLSDGVLQPARGEIQKSIQGLSDTPIFVAGVGQSRTWRDLRIAKISVKRSNFDKSPVSISINLHAAGLRGEQIVAEIIQGDRVVKSRLVTVTSDVEEQAVSLEFVPQQKSWIEYKARVRLAETGPWDRADANTDIAVPKKDPIYQNNVADFVVDNRDKQYRILYFAGRPNWENKFFRRAISEDPQLKLTSLIRISGAQRKFVFRGQKSSLSNPLFEGFEGQEVQPRYDEAVFLRIGVEDESDLVTGYPEHGESLFPFHLVIWSSIEHNFFSNEQLELTREFVEKRGGSILFLGGGSSFTEGNYDGTVIEGMIPVVLEKTASRKRNHQTVSFHVEPTVEGRLAGSWQLDAATRVNDRLWDEMPALHGLNLFPRVRAGASVLARVKSDDPDIDGRPFFIVQRYGEGRSAVLATGATWQWQMQKDLEDQSQERLWRQIVRSLVNDVPEALYLRNKKDIYANGSPGVFEFIVRDELFDEREVLTTTLEITPPSGEATMAPVDESIREPGLYTSEYTPTQPGMHRLVLTAENDKHHIIGTLEEAILVGADQREFKNAQYDGDFLRSLSESMGGQYFPLRDLPKIVAKIPWRPSHDEEITLFHLWYFPGFFFTILTLLTLDWYIRRRRGRP